MHTLERLIASVLSALGLDPAWLVYAAPVSVLVMVLTAVLTPWLVARIPEDYFVRAHERDHTGHWVIRAVMLVIKNVLGALLVGAGAAMLVLPGPGILTLLGGVALVNLPGKRRIECWMVSRPGVRDLIALLRARAGRPPLRLPARYG
jgi:hypothetical protein